MGGNKTDNTGNVLENNQGSGDEDETLEMTKEGELFTRKKRGLISSLQFFIERFLFLLYFLDIFSNFIEKTEKLIKWQDKKTTKTFFVFLICAFFVVTFLPIRYFVILGLLKKFARGKTYYQRRHTGN